MQGLINYENSQSRQNAEGFISALSDLTTILGSVEIKGPEIEKEINSGYIVSLYGEQLAQAGIPDLLALTAKANNGRRLQNSTLHHHIYFFPGTIVYE